jgi:hypothetical protein
MTGGVYAVQALGLNSRRRIQKRLKEGSTKLKVLKVWWHAATLFVLFYLFFLHYMAANGYI